MAQNEVRNVKVENTSLSSILVRVSYQKSAIKSQQFKKFSKLMTENINSSGKGGGIGVGIPGYANFNMNFKKQQAHTDVVSDETFDTAQVELILSPFLEEGWIAITPKKSKRFGVQGQIAWISVIDGQGTLIVPGWNSTGNSFVYDGEDFEEVEEDIPTNITIQEQTKPETETREVTSIISSNEAQDEQQKRSEINEYNEWESIGDIWSTSPKRCCAVDVQMKALPFCYLVICLGFFHFIWDCLFASLVCSFALCFAPCYCGEIVSKYKKVVMCTLLPMKMEYRISNNGCCECNGLCFFVVTAPVYGMLTFMHFAMGCVWAFGSCGGLYPISKIHWHLCKINLKPWRYDIRRKQ